MGNQAADDARRKAREEKLDAFRNQVYPNLGKLDPTDSTLDQARQARATLPLRTKIVGWFAVAFGLLIAYAMIQQRPPDQRVVAYWLVGWIVGIIIIFVVVMSIQHDRRAKRLRDNPPQGSPSGR